MQTNKVEGTVKLLTKIIIDCSNYVLNISDMTVTSDISVVQIIVNFNLN